MRNHQPSTINHQPSTINHQPSTINQMGRLAFFRDYEMRNRLFDK